MRLIDKDALMAVLGITDEECSKCNLGDGTGYCTFSSEWTTACDEICTAPVIEERKTGKWIDCNGSEHWKCDQCGCRAGYWFNEENSSSYELDISEWLSDYCPNCGADMRGEKNGIIG